MSLRDYQVDAIERCRAKFRSGARAVCLVMPTGAGKTATGAEVVRSHVAKGGHVLWVGHRIELVGQAAARLRAEGLHVGIVAAGMTPDPIAPVQIASVQTLAARDERPPASLVVLDEAHHYPAETWGAVAEHYAKVPRLGLTATPERADGKPLGDLFDALVAPIGVAELTRRGFLVPCEVHAPPKRLRGSMAGDPVDRYLAAARGRPALFFAQTVPQATELAARLRAAGITAACVHAETPAEERAEALAKFAAGELGALTNVYVLTEGTDLPPAEVAVLARGFGHASTYLQCVGRVLRPSPETGKKSALVLDLCGVSRRFGVPADARTYSLDGRAIELVGKPRDDDEERGGGVVTAPEVIDEELALVREIAEVAGKWTRGAGGAKRQALEGFLREAVTLGFRPGWAVFRFVERYGHKPWEPR